MAWYRTYRPQTVSQLAITPVREYMQQLLQSGRYAHAYLFTGPKGVGKTSTARILARILNDPQNQAKVLAGKGSLKEPDSDHALLRQIAQGGSQVVIEQDAASHRGIDDIRALQEHVSVVPTEGLVRVVILDEVHMLTNEAFNALLKLLEEPPQRVVFILATTEPHKIPDTVKSRCEQIQFRQATTNEIVAVLKNVVKEEKLKIEEDVLEQLAVVAQGSFRDAIKYLESITSDGQIDESMLQNLVGSQQSARELLRALATADASKVSEYFQQARHSGRQFKVIEQQLFWQLQQRLHRAIERQEKPQTRQNILSLMNFLVSYLEGYEPIDGLRLELACLSWCFEKGDISAVGSNHSDQGGGVKSNSHRKSKSHSKSNGRKKKSLERKSQQTSKKFSTVAALQTATSKVKKNSTNLDSNHLDTSPNSKQEIGKLAINGHLTKDRLSLSRAQVQEQWEELLLYIRTQSQALESLLRNASLGTVQNNVIEIQFELAFHLEKLETPKYKSLLLTILREKIHPQVEFTTHLLAPIQTEQPTSSSVNDDEDQLLSAVEAAVLSVAESKIIKAIN